MSQPKIVLDSYACPNERCHAYRREPERERRRGTENPGPCHRCGWLRKLTGLLVVYR